LAKIKLGLAIARLAMNKMTPMNIKNMCLLFLRVISERTQ
jgi:hypothetical protein